MNGSAILMYLRTVLFVFLYVKRRRLELPRHNWHYPLKVARLPIPPPLRLIFLTRIRSHSPKKILPGMSAQDRTRTCTSRDTRTWNVRVYQFRHLGKFCASVSCLFNKWSGKRDSDPRPQPWQGCALPTELFPHFLLSLYPFSEVLQISISLNAMQRYNYFLKLQNFFRFFSLKPSFFFISWPKST